MSQFFKALQLLLKDRQEFELNAKKIGEDLVLSIIPDKKGKGKLFHITVPAEDINDEIDSKIFAELSSTATSEKATYKSTQTDAPEKDDDDDDQQDDKAKNTTSNKSNKKDDKKAGSKKAAPKKEAKASKRQTKQPEIPLEQSAPEEKEDDQKNDETLTKDSETVQESEQTITKTEIPVQEKKNEASYDNEGPSPEDIFEHFMSEGKKCFDERNYKGAEEAYQNAVELFPQNEKAITSLANATKWVKAVERIHQKK